MVKVKCSCNSKNISKYAKLLKYNLENEDFLLMLHNELNGLEKLFLGVHLQLRKNFMNAISHSFEVKT